LGPRLEHEARRRIDLACDDEFALGLPLHLRAVLRGGGLTFSSYVHLLSTSVSIPRQQCPTRRSARPRAGDTCRSMPPLLPVHAARACRSARAQSSPWSRAPLAPRRLPASSCP